MELCLEVVGDGLGLCFVAGFGGGGVWVAWAVVSGEESEIGGTARYRVDVDGDFGVFATGGGSRDGDVGGDFGGEFLLSLG